jgi:hypothetical protein
MKMEIAYGLYLNIISFAMFLLAMFLLSSGTCNFTNAIIIFACGFILYIISYNITLLAINKKLEMIGKW